MKALTLYQPWASAMALGLKRVETRPAWAMQLRRLVGEDVAVHAGVCTHWPSRYDLAAMHLAHTVPAEAMASLSSVGIEYPYQWTLTAAPRGAILAVVRVAAVVPIRGDDAQYDNEPGDWIVDSSRWYPGTSLGSLRRITTTRHGTGVCSAVVDLADQEPWGDWTPGRVAVITDSLRPLAKPVPVRGHQRAWNLPADVEAAVRSQVDVA